MMGTKTAAMWYPGSRFEIARAAPKRVLHRRKSQPIPSAKGRTLRQIGTVPKGLDAKAFSDYLLSAGMKTRIDDRPEGWEVWIYNEDHLQRA